MILVVPIETNVLPGVYAYGFERPSAIQMRAIMPVIKGNFSRIVSSIPPLLMDPQRL